MVDDAQLSRAEHAAREDAYAGQVLNTAKIVTPFTAALAATLLATALQVGRPTCLDYVAAWSMAPAVLITVGIVFVQKATLKSTDLEPQAISGAHTKFMNNAKENLRRAHWVHWAMLAQVALSLATSAIAVIEVLLWLRGHPPG